MSSNCGASPANSPHGVKDDLVGLADRIRRAAAEDLLQPVGAELFVFGIDRLGYAVGVKHDEFSRLQRDATLLELVLGHDAERHAVPSSAGTPTIPSACTRSGGL